MKISSSARVGSTLVVTIIVVATLLVLLGVAVDYTTQISRTTQRSRKTALAMEIADGHLETLFTNWRNIYRSTWTTMYGNTGGTDYSLVGTNFFRTAMYTPSPGPTAIAMMSPSPAPVPPIIPLPSPSNFSDPSYTVNQYRIQAVDPMITLDSNDNALVETASAKTGSNYVAMNAAWQPPAAYGPNAWQYSYFYLAAADVTVPALAGPVKAKVRRVFEKKFDQPWTFAMFFVDDLEFQPSSPFTINGPVHTNSSLYIGTNNFTAMSPTINFPTSGRVEYGSDFVNGYSPNDPRYPGSGFTSPNFAKSDPSLAISDCPPAQVSPYLPFGWNITLSSADTSTNNDSYHEIIEQPAASPTPDPLTYIRYYNQASYRLLISANNTVQVWQYNPSTGTATQLTNGTIYVAFMGNSGGGNSTPIVTTNQGMNDAREGGIVRCVNIDVSRLTSYVNAGTLTGWNGVLYIADTSATIYKADRTVLTPGSSPSPAVPVSGTSTTSNNTTKRAIRLINGGVLPDPPASTTTTPSPAYAKNGYSGNAPFKGVTIVSPNPVYIKGDFNTGYTGSGTTPSNASNAYPTASATPFPYVSGYTPKPAAIVADAITVLSNNWNDNNSVSASGITARLATNTTINAAFVAGNVPSGGGYYSGGGENFIRLLEDWNRSGSPANLTLYGSIVQLYASNQAIGRWDSSVYVAPAATKFFYDTNLSTAFTPPGSLQLAAYLQQQRWYQVY